MSTFGAGTAKLEITHALVMPASAGIRIPAFAGMTNLGTRESVHRFGKRDVFLRDTARIMGG